MISKDEIKRLADLARIEIGDNEVEKLAGEIDAILGYVGQVSAIAGAETDKEGDGRIELGPIINVMREDENPTESGTYSKELIAEFPDKQGDYLKVKKIL